MSYWRILTALVLQRLFSELDKVNETFNVRNILLLLLLPSSSSYYYFFFYDYSCCCYYYYFYYYYYYYYNYIILLLLPLQWACESSGVGYKHFLARERRSRLCVFAVSLPWARPPAAALRSENCWVLPTPCNRTY